jgi:hypothetical protein
LNPKGSVRAAYPDWQSSFCNSCFHNCFIIY